MKQNSKRTAKFLLTVISNDVAGAAGTVCVSVFMLAAQPFLTW